MRRAAVLTTFVLVLLSTEAAAQPVSEDGPYSGTAALSLSLAGAVGGLGMLVAGITWPGNENAGLLWAGAGTLLVGPDLGHVYTGDYRRALIGTGLRLGGVGLLGIGFLVMDAKCSANHDDFVCAEPASELIYLLAVGLEVSAIVWSIADSPASARRRNREAAARRVSFSPMLDGGQGTVGLQLVGTF